MILTSINSHLVAIANRIRTLSLEMLRIGCGILLVFGHGYGKMFGERAQPFTGGKDFFGIDLGINMMWIAGFIEFYVGILVILGLFTRWTALLMITLMVMAYCSSHLAWFPTLRGGELAAVYFLVFIVIFAHGPGPYSLDTRLFEKKFV